MQPHEASHCKAVSVAVISASENTSETPMADTINPGTRLIEEVALFPESVRFESRSEEHTSELQSHLNLVCRLLLEKKNHSPADNCSSCILFLGSEALLP